MEGWTGKGWGWGWDWSSGPLVVLFLSEAMRRCDAVLYWAGGDARWGADRYLGGVQGDCQSYQLAATVVGPSLHSLQLIQDRLRGGYL